MNLRFMEWSVQQALNQLTRVLCTEPTFQAWHVIIIITITSDRRHSVQHPQGARPESPKKMVLRCCRRSSRTLAFP